MCVIGVVTSDTERVVMVVACVNHSVCGVCDVYGVTAANDDGMSLLRMSDES